MYYCIIIILLYLLLYKIFGVVWNKFYTCKLFYLYNVFIYYIIIILFYSYITIYFLNHIFFHSRNNSILVMIGDTLCCQDALYPSVDWYTLYICVARAKNSSRRIAEVFARDCPRSLHNPGSPRSSSRNSVWTIEKIWRTNFIVCSLCIRA